MAQILNPLFESVLRPYEPFKPNWFIPRCGVSGVVTHLLQGLTTRYAERVYFDVPSMSTIYQNPEFRSGGNSRSGRGFAVETNGNVLVLANELVPRV